MKHALIALPFAAAIAGCATDFPRNMPLVFGESITVGVGVGTSTAEGGGDFTLGVKTRDVAVIPVVTYDHAGNPIPLRAENDEKSKAGQVAQDNNGVATTTTNPKEKIVLRDAFSVLGVFSTDTSATSKTVGIGKFFATGAAAQRIAEGFSGCLEKNGCSGAGK